jgi:hypothetical protein
MGRDRRQGKATTYMVLERGTNINVHRIGLLYLQVQYDWSQATCCTKKWQKTGLLHLSRHCLTKQTLPSVYSTQNNVILFLNLDSTAQPRHTGWWKIWKHQTMHFHEGKKNILNIFFAISCDGLTATLLCISLFLSTSWIKTYGGCVVNSANMTQQEEKSVAKPCCQPYV